MSPDYTPSGSFSMWRLTICSMFKTHAFALSVPGAVCLDPQLRTSGRAGHAQNRKNSWNDTAGFGFLDALGTAQRVDLRRDAAQCLAPAAQDASRWISDSTERARLMAT